MGHCVLHGFYQFSEFFVDICMGFMHFRRFVNVLHGFYRFSLIIAVACMGFISFSQYLLLFVWVMCVSLCLCVVSRTSDP